MARLTLKVLGKPVAIVLLRRSGEKVPEHIQNEKASHLFWILCCFRLSVYTAFWFFWQFSFVVKVYLREPGLCESKHLKGSGSVSVLHFFHQLASLEATKLRPTWWISSGMDTGATSGAKPCPGTRSEEKFPWKRWGPSQERKKVGKQTFPVRTQVYQASKLQMVGNSFV